jgi:phosphomannomutase
MRGGVVKTIVGTKLIDNIIRKLGLKLYETPIGFKYISNLMEKNDILVGGEEAGGIGFKGYIPERDGILAGLLLLEMMCYRKKPILDILKEMEKEFGRYYYLRDDLKIQNSPAKAGSRKMREKFKIQKFKKIKRLLGKKVIKIKDYDGIKLICEDESWLMFRVSGTEPIMRVYAESKNLNRSKKLIEFSKHALYST